MSATCTPADNGRFRVSRDFGSMEAAARAAALLESVRDPVEREPVSFEADPKLQALLDRTDEDAPLEGLTAGKAVAPDPAPPADFHVGAQSGAVVAVE